MVLGVFKRFRTGKASGSKRSRPEDAELDGLVSEARVLQASGLTVDGLLVKLLSQAQCVMVLMAIEELGLAEAQEVVDVSGAWSDRAEVNESARQALVDALVEADEFDWAIQRGDLETVKRMLESGVSPNVGLPDIDETAMHSAISQGHAELIDLLAEYGGDLEQRDKSGCSALSRAASGADGSRMVGVLLSLGAVVDSVDNAGWCPLHYAAAYGFQQNVEVLLKAGADAGLLTRAGLSAQDLARRNSHSLQGLS